MESELLEAIEESQRLFIHANAVFYAERLFSRYPSLHSLLVVSKVYMDSGDNSTAARLLRSYSPFSQLAAYHPTCAFRDDTQVEALRRRCWYQLGVACAQCGKFSDGEHALAEVIPSADGAAEYWMGVCLRRLLRGSAQQNFAESYRRNPKLYVAFEESTKARPAGAVAGTPLHPNPYAELLEDLAERTAASPVVGSSMGAPQSSGGSSAADTRGNAAPSAGQNAEMDHPQQQQRNTSSRFSAPPPPRSLPQAAAVAASTTSMAGRRTLSGARTSGSSPPPVPHFRSSSHCAGGSPKGPPPRQLGKSSFAHLPEEGLASAGSSTTSSSSSRSQLWHYLAHFAEVTVLLGAYHNQDALRFLLSETFPERDTGWFWGNVGMTNFHAGSVQDARHAFDRLRQCEPWRLNDPVLVYYSTTLWHLKEEQALGTLTQLLIEELPLSAVTLCVAGNCYSLVRDARMSLQMLSRATAVDKNFAYAYTLYGYELLANDKPEADAAFSKAHLRDPLNYMALAGLGEISYRRDNMSKAQHYFLAATSINPHPNIMSRLASTYHRRGATQDALRRALEIYDSLLVRNPANVGARHQRAEVLMKLKRYDEALRELEKLRNECPEEAMLHVTLGRCYHRLNRVTHANQHYQKALDLDPRRAALVKNCLERLQQSQPPDDDD